ncbi:MAG: dTMP kinase [Candidatus Peribacteraceae bacterium]|jgi:dTMP kinase|nr:dTMP kinase [Candidatus Peribacteraceae bacterium]MDP7454330.1 dTMP kinase [Candidatus Peribacteraceae bacterium]MDP7645728.1 dTMP kinase [Candidatus Peribacteraceae bacterium]|tara:strand:+ start:2259 stop:2864 length:606 start_codon:yes stop_codon:yes gene_type:complete
MPPFIVFEGPDGSGTSLHAKLLFKRLLEAKLSVISTFEPTDGPIGSIIREKLKSHDEIPPDELQKLFVKDREWHISEVIKPALGKGSIVISDRYYHSTICYGKALGLDETKLKNLNKDFIQPQVVFFLLPPFEVCKERMSRREHHDSLEGNELQMKVYEMYKKMAEEDPSIIVVDTSEEKEEVAENIYKHVCKKLELQVNS